jgi:hypothetical protein
MKIFVITTGENIPLLGDKGKQMRSSILCEKLSVNNDVTYLTSDFNHFSKKRREFNNILKNKYKINVIKSFAYKKNISISRFINHFLFSCKIFFFLLTKKIDLIICSYPLLECCAAVKLLSKFKSFKFFFDIRDLWPDNFDRKIIYYPVIFFYKCLMKFSLNNENIITISNSYKAWLNKNNIKSTSVKVFPLSSSSRNNFFIKKKHENKIVLWFLGSLGYSYELEHILKFSNYLMSINIEIIITGDGYKKKYFQKKFGHNKNVLFTGWLSEKKIKYYSALADVGLMTYSMNATQGYPNKLFDYLSYGLPVMSSLKNKETVSLIKKNKLGWNYDMNSNYSVLNCFKSISTNRRLLDDKFIHIRSFYKKNFDKDKIYYDYCKYIEDFK